MAEDFQKQLRDEVLESAGDVLDRLVKLYRRFYAGIDQHHSLGRRGRQVPSQRVDQSHKA